MVNRKDQGEAASQNDFSAWLKRQIAESGVEQSRIAAEAGIKPGYLSMLRSGGKTSPSERVVRALASAIARIRREPEDVLIAQAFDAAGLRWAVPGSSQEGLVEIGKQLVAIRPLDYLLEREGDSREIWLIRSNTYFLSGFPGATRNSMIRLLSEDPERHFYFLFRDSPTTDRDKPKKDEELQLLRPSDNPPRDSFANFKKALLLKDTAEQSPPMEGLFARAHGYPVHSSAEMLALGLGMTYAATVILVYKEEARERLRREYDIFSEMYIATYPDVATRSEDMEYLAWIEVPPRRARTLWVSWDPILLRIREESKAAGFLYTPDEAKSFLPGQLINF